MQKRYKNTKVDWAKSQTAIIKLLNSVGIYESRFTNLLDKVAIEFRIMETKNLAFKIGVGKGITVRVITPIRLVDEKNREQELNRVHRVLFYHLKAKFVAIEDGIAEFMQEFMAHLVIMDKQGNSTTIGQTLLPQYKKSIESGEQGEFKLLGDGKD